MICVEMSNGGELKDLMDAAEYKEYCGEEA
jgi:hypothetical protein